MYFYKSNTYDPYQRLGQAICLAAVTDYINKVEGPLGYCTAKRFLTSGAFALFSGLDISGPSIIRMLDKITPGELEKRLKSAGDEGD